MEHLKEIIEDTEDFFYVDDSIVKQLSLDLSEHMRNKLYYNPTPLKICNGITLNKDYSTKNLRQSFFESCKFDGVNYSDAGLAGSLFINSSFSESNLHNTNFSACDFRKCLFNNIKKGLNYTRFSKSIFTDTNFTDCIFNGVLLNDAIIVDSSFINCEWTPVSAENVVFKDTLLHRVKFRNMNLEFTTFDNVKLDEIKLPFPTIPYIFNGLTYLSTTSDNVRITSAQQKDGISIEQYLEITNKLSEFYKYTHNYFPLANILISKEMYKEAFAAVLNGINLSLELRRFRMLKNYCKQLKYIDGVSMQARQSLYKYILEKITSLNYQDFEAENLNMYLPEVRQLLLDDLKEQKIEVSFSTNIENDDSQRISLLIGIIDAVLTGNCNYSIELRHNCPWDFFIPIFANPDCVSNIINTLTMIFTSIQTSISVKQALSKNGKKEIISNKQINEYKQTLEDSGIIIMNLTINNSGTININNNIIAK